jgi:hypothetical protein
MKNLRKKIGLLSTTGLVVLALVFGSKIMFAKGIEVPAISTSAVQFTAPPKVAGARRHQLLLPLEDLIAHNKALVAVVEPTERKKVVVVSVEVLSSMKAIERESVEGIIADYDGYPFTPIEVKAVEVLKGNIPEEFELWEERGEMAGFKVESDDPFLSPGVRGLLVAGSYDNGVIAPLIFAPIQDDGYVPDLQMSLDDFRKMLK